MWSASRSRHTGCLVLAAVLAAALPAQTAESSRAVELLEQEEGVVQASLVKLESWCAKEVGSQKKQQGELLRLKAELASDADSAEAESELAAPSSPKLPTQAASSLLSTGSKAKGAFHDLDLQVKCLQDAEKELKTQSEGSFWFFRSPVEKGLMALQKVLGSLEADRSKEQHELTNVQHTPEPDMHEDEADIPTSQLSKDSARQAKKLAAARGQQVLDAALSKGQEALSEAASVCEVGRAVLGRVEQQSRPLREHAIELIGRVEGSLGLAAATAVASASNTSAGPKSNQDDLVRELLRQLQQQQALQQQQLQQQQIAAATAYHVPEVRLAGASARTAVAAIAAEVGRAGTATRTAVTAIASSAGATVRDAAPAAVPAAAAAAVPAGAAGAGAAAILAAATATAGATASLLADAAPADAAPVAGTAAAATASPLADTATAAAGTAAAV